MQFRRLLLVSVLAVLASSFGCTTYVNIPPQANDVASHNPNQGSVLAVQRQALSAVVDYYKIDQPFTISPLPKTAPSFCLTMARNVNCNATVDRIAGAPEIEIKRLHIRGWNAQVDIVHHGSQIVESDLAGTDLQGDQVSTELENNSRQAITVSLQYQMFSGWRTKRVKVWLVDVDQALLAEVRPSQVDMAP